MKYDYLLLGASGQVGRCILRSLTTQGAIAVLMRRRSTHQAENELRELVGDEVYDAASITIYIGDILETELPCSNAIIHAAGLTKFSSTFSDYWTANVMSTIRLAHHARNTNARLHLLSTISVAQCRDSMLYEDDKPIPHQEQSNYALSKCISELIASEILPSKHLSIYRISDVVPELPRLVKDLRRNHWLTLLLGTGFAKRCHLPDNYEFYLLAGAELGRTFATLVSTATPGTFHLFGKKYTWSILKHAATEILLAEKRKRVGAYIERIIGDKISLASLVDDTKTRNLLQNSGEEWSYLEPNYWQALAREAALALI